MNPKDTASPGSTRADPHRRRLRFAAALRASALAHRDLPRAWRVLAWLSVVLALGCALFPTDHARDYAVRRRGDQDTAVVAVEYVVRHVNTAAAIALPVLKRDLVGLAQLSAVGVAGTAATHVPKRLLNDWRVLDTRIGQRPHRPDSKGNVPSGHTSLASCAAWFACRRYGWHWAWSLAPVVAATMWARVMLDEHTLSAVLSGLFVGLAVVAFLVTPRDRLVAGSASPGTGFDERRRLRP